MSPPQVNEVGSPTKPAAPFSPESWYRKAYEESRAGSRPTPEGAGSALGSSGTPSPGSGTSSPSSFTGSPGPASPGIGTSSPGSLGGSPGFGTGSPGSGSGGGSSPGSDRGVWCENCNARLVELKRQALKLLLPGPFPGKVSAGGGRAGDGAAAEDLGGPATVGRFAAAAWSGGPEALRAAPPRRGRWLGWGIPPRELPRASPPPGCPWAQSLDAASEVPGLAVHPGGSRLLVLSPSTHQSALSVPPCRRRAAPLDPRGAAFPPSPQTETPFPRVLRSLPLGRPGTC